MKKKNVVFIHGWGFNSKIWNFNKSSFSHYFNTYCIDLPGYGNNYHLNEIHLKEISKKVLEMFPTKSILVGWSYGGLIATFITINFQSKVSALITISSSPCFMKKENWPGFTLKNFLFFKKNIKNNFEKTIKNFINNQLYKKEVAIRKKIEFLENEILKNPKPSINILSSGLKILQKTDLRKSILEIKKPFLRIYGDLDTLVSKKIKFILDRKLPKSNSIIIKNSAHMPFLSRPDKFLKILTSFINNINLN